MLADYTFFTLQFTICSDFTKMYKNNWNKDSRYLMTDFLVSFKAGCVQTLLKSSLKQAY